MRQSGTIPVFTFLILLSVEWEKVIAVSPFVVKFGILALMGALVSGLMAKDEDIRGSIRKGCAAIILGTVLPLLATTWEVDAKWCYIVAFAIGLGIDIIYPYLRRYIDKVADKVTKTDE